MSAQLAISLLCVALSALLAPLLPGVINRVKAHVAGRKGRPLLQLYYDMAKLMRKSPVYPEASTLFFRIAPVAGVASTLTALAVLPFGPFGSAFGFSGDFLFFGALFALARFTLILAALDTGSAFEGMGAAREALFSALAEPVLLFSLLVLGFHSQQQSLTGMLGAISPSSWLGNWPFYLMLGIALFLLLLPENCRIPVDDPNTHLELTMIHEVMILDHSGPELAFLEYAAALKLWIFCLLISGLLVPGLFGPLFTPEGALGASGGTGVLGSALLVLLAVFVLAVLIGLVESLMARLRLERVPQVLTLAACFAVFASLLLWR